MFFTDIRKISYIEAGRRSLIIAILSAFAMTVLDHDNLLTKAFCNKCIYFTSAIFAFAYLYFFFAHFCFSCLSPWCHVAKSKEMINEKNKILSIFAFIEVEIFSRVYLIDYSCCKCANNKISKRHKVSIRIKLSKQHIRKSSRSKVRGIFRFFS